MRRSCLVFQCAGVGPRRLIPPEVVYRLSCSRCGPKNASLLPVPLQAAAPQLTHTLDDSRDLGAKGSDPSARSGCLTASYRRRPVTFICPRSRTTHQQNRSKILSISKRVDPNSTTGAEAQPEGPCRGPGTPSLGWGESARGSLKLRSGPELSHRYLNDPCAVVPSARDAIPSSRC
jgi:hypothetical protein